MALFAYEFSVAWCRVLANFPFLPQLVREELEPYKPLVDQAQADGRPLVQLAAQINDITERHMRVHVVRMDLHEFAGSPTVQ